MTPVFKRTPEECAELCDLMNRGYGFTRDTLSIEFETTREFMEENLPPCFKPLPQPTLGVEIARWQSAACGDFEGAMVWAYVSCEGVEGAVDLFAIFPPLDGISDQAVTYAREIWGEAAYSGHAGLFEHEGYAHGWGGRTGVNLMEIEAEFGDDLGPREIDSTSFTLKAFPTPLGEGLEWNPLVFETRVHDSYSYWREGTGQLTLRSGLFDRLGDIPIVSTGTVVRACGTSIWNFSARHEYENRDDFVPYVYGRGWDDLAKLFVPQMWRDKSKRHWLSVGS